MLTYEQLCETIQQQVNQYAREHQAQDLWRSPLVGVADANDPAFRTLRQAVSSTHALPTDILPGAKSVISYFVPFQPPVGESNLPGLRPSETWARGYRVSNAMFSHINDRLVHDLQALGYQAQIPGTFAGMDTEKLMSNWSQRHVAWVAGLGTFGCNNMLITSQGCLGRIASFVTDIPLIPTPRPKQERCLSKRGFSCGRCVQHCPSGALTTEGFDRRTCYNLCAENDRLLNPPGAPYWEAEICGKCVVGLPCTLQNPCAQLDQSHGVG